MMLKCIAIRSNARVEDNGEQVDTGAGVDTGVVDGEIGDREKIQIGSEHSLWGIELDGMDGGQSEEDEVEENAGVMEENSVDVSGAGDRPQRGRRAPTWHQDYVM